ncbi:MAG: hypothetical protein GDA51_03135 [Ekhidna sp.]|nr:hypothetical protein [Ekhidna sp.]
MQALELPQPKVGWQKRAVGGSYKLHLRIFEKGQDGLHKQKTMPIS